MGARLIIRSVDGRQIDCEVSCSFDQDRLVIGRGRSADIRVPHRSVSELHATLRREGDAYSLTDDGSTNGTRVAGAGLVAHRPRRLRDGDRLELGVYTLSFHTGVLVTDPLSAERSSQFARCLLRAAPPGGRAETRPPRLVVVWGKDSGKHLSLDRDRKRWMIGRSADCQMSLDDPALADAHLEVTLEPDGVSLRCAEGASEMWFGGAGRQSLRPRDGDELRIGDTALLFEEPTEQPLFASAEGDDEPLPPGYRAAPPEPEPPPPPPESAGPDAAADDAAPTPAVSPTPARAPRAGADLVIYLMAAAILALSASALIVLMRSH